MLAGLLLLGLVPLTGTSDALDSIVGWPLISVLTCGVIYGCLRGAAPLTRPLGNRVMTAIGKRSYGLYLWHFPIFVVIDTRWGLDGWDAKLPAIAVSAVVVALSYRYIERPFLERKDRRRTRTATEAPTLRGEPVAAVALES